MYYHKLYKIKKNVYFLYCKPLIKISNYYLLSDGKLLLTYCTLKYFVKVVISYYTHRYNIYTIHHT